ncbi:MAG: rRNA maturation RNase YbeY [Burkholderiales bacterium]|jgi:probable rRNA maturation factor|nr:rRNA maturation RNase YbeY [Burkholderiales bacterium]
MKNIYLTIQSNTRGAIPVRATLRRWIHAAFDSKITHKKFFEADITVRFVNGKEGRALNGTYRKKDYATNVLTFVYEQDWRCVGDIVLCMPVLRQEAREQHKTWRAHCAHLLIHGVLHLQGFDHDNDADARQMEHTEIAVLGVLGYPNPYQDRD